MPTDYSWPLIYSLINIKQQEDKPACARCARTSVCTVELCGKQGCFLVGGFLYASSGSLLVSIINIPRHILLRLYLAKQTDPCSTAEPFASAVVLIRSPDGGFQCCAFNSLEKLSQRVPSGFSTIE